MRILQGHGTHAQVLPAPGVARPAPQDPRGAHGQAQPPALRRHLRWRPHGRCPEADEAAPARRAEAQAPLPRGQRLRRAHQQPRRQAHEGPQDQARPGLERPEGDRAARAAGRLGQGSQGGLGGQGHDRRRGVPAQGAARADGHLRREAVRRRGRRGAGDR